MTNTEAEGQAQASVKSAILACLVEDFENDERCEHILARLEGRIMQSVTALMEAHRTELRVVCDARDFWYQQYKFRTGAY